MSVTGDVLKEKLHKALEAKEVIVRFGGCTCW